MAMLAEPRRKQKLSINPQGTAWSNDESKFGQKMLEKMGWSKGKGLGAKEDGRVDHVKINLKNDQKGVGCSKNFSDNWITHQDDFNTLLQSLNHDHGEDNSVKQVTSLEKKSQSSRSRVHYGKFTRGKDLSSRSNHDLKCIFGQRGDKALSRDETPTNDTAEYSELEDSTLEESHGFTTIKSTSNLQEYFAKKMAALKDQQVVREDNYEEKNMVEQKNAVEDENDEMKSDNKKKKKRAKKRGRDSLEDSVVDRDCLDRKEITAESEHQENELSQECCKPPKKKQKKKRLKDSVEEENSCASPELVEFEENVREGRKQKKAKKKKRARNEEPVIETEEKTVEMPFPKRKKKKKTSVKRASLKKENETEMAEMLVKKKVKKRRNDLPQVIRTVCRSFRGANVASIHGYDKTSMCEREMLKRIEDRHKLILQHFEK